jgi:DNA polymerase-3 subunit alpha
MKDENKGMMSLFQFPELDEWSDKEKLKKEKESLGFYITGHPLNEYRQAVKLFTTSSIQGMLELDDRSEVKIAGVIAGVSMKRTKRGDRMAVVTLEDQTGSAEAVFFPEAFTNFSHLLVGDDPLLITGIAELSDKRAKIIAKEVESLEVRRQKSVKVIKFELDEKKINKQYLEELRDIFFKYPGESCVEFRLEGDDGQVFNICANDHYRVLPCDEMMCEIEERTGQRIPCSYH